MAQSITRRGVAVHRTVDGFGIETVWYEGSSYLLQHLLPTLSHPFPREQERIDYASATAAEDAFAYVSSRAHYGR